MRLLIYLPILFLLTCSNLQARELYYSSYDESHMKIVESGFQSFMEHFSNSDVEQKGSLLLCLDRYLDPYIQSDITYKEELYAWLEALVESDEELIIKEEALALLAWHPDQNYVDCEITETGSLACPGDTN